MEKVAIIAIIIHRLVDLLAQVAFKDIIMIAILKCATNVLKDVILVVIHTLVVNVAINIIYLIINV